MCVCVSGGGGGGGEEGTAIEITHAHAVKWVCGMTTDMVSSPGIQMSDIELTT